MQLVKLNSDTLQMLPTEGARAYVKDKYLGRTIRGMEVDEMLDAVMDIIAKGHRNLGHVPSVGDKDQNKHTAKQVISAILNAKEFKKGRTTYDLRNVTIEELDKSVSELTLGAYKKKPDEVVIVSASTILYGLECYFTEPARLASIKYYQALLDTPVKKAEPSKEQQDYEIKKGLDSAIEKFKKENEFPPASLCRIFFDYLKRKGEINLSDEEREQWLDKAQKACFESAKYERKGMTRNGFYDAMNKIEAKGAPVLKKAKELYFKEWIKTAPNA